MGKSSSRKLRRAIYYMLYRMDPQKTHYKISCSAKTSNIKKRNVFCLYPPPLTPYRLKAGPICIPFEGTPHSDHQLFCDNLRNHSQIKVSELTQRREERKKRCEMEKCAEKYKVKKDKKTRQKMPKPHQHEPQEAEERGQPNEECWVSLWT